MSLADTVIGATIALVGSVGTQVSIGRRGARDARRGSRHSSMLGIFEGLTDEYALIIEFAKKKRAAGGQTPGEAVELMTKRLHLRLHVEMLDDERVRKFAYGTLNTLATLVRGVAPDPGDPEATREDTAVNLRAATKGLEDLAARIGEITRVDELGWWARRRHRS